MFHIFDSLVILACVAVVIAEGEGEREKVREERGTPGYILLFFFCFVLMSG